MAINVNTVYKTVLSIMNKEQRGQATPDEFNKIAAKVELSLLDKSFFDLNKSLVYKSQKAVNQGVSDTTENFQDKLDAFYKTSNISILSGSATMPSDLYKIIDIVTNDRLKKYEEIKMHEMSYMLSSPLTSPTSMFPVYYVGNTGNNISVIPQLADNSTLTINYIKKPLGPRFGYSRDAAYGVNIYDPNEFVDGGIAVKPGLTNSLSDNNRTAADGTYTGLTTTSGTGSGLIVTVTVVSNLITSVIVTSPGSGYSIGDVISITGGGELTLTSNNLYNSSTYGSRDFELHPSEEVSLINGILAYLGITIRDQSITAMASQIIQSNEATKQ